MGEYPQIVLFCYSISLQKTEKDTAEQWAFLRSKVLFSSCEIQHQNKTRYAFGVAGFSLPFHFVIQLSDFTLARCADLHANGVDVPTFGTQVCAQGR